MMFKLIKDDKRFVDGYLNYRVPVDLDPQQSFGPTDGEYPMMLWPVEANEDRTRYGFTATPPKEND